MALLLTVVLFLGGALVTAVALRLQARRRGRALQDLVLAEGATWGGLCRVTSGGEFLDQGRPRRGKGPRGTLFAGSTVLRWTPDKYEAEHGDQPFTWPWTDVRCTNTRAYRDITGILAEKLALSLPQGRMTVVVFCATGSRPESFVLSRDG